MAVAVRRCVLLVVALSLLALPVQAELYTVQLENGNSFESRYRPQAASWDDSQILLLTDVGNWIALPRAEISGMTVDTEVKGFGLVIDTTTVALGIAPNDLPTEEATAADPQLQLLQYLQQQAERPPYSVEQFVEPTEAGGIPVWMTNTVTPPLGGEPPQR